MAKATKPKTVKGKSKGKGGKGKTPPAPKTETVKEVRICGLRFFVGTPYEDDIKGW
jgi:hypothetical protein